MARIRRVDTQGLGLGELLARGEFGIDLSGTGDDGRVYIGTGTENKVLALVDDVGAFIVTVGTAGQTNVNVVDSSKVLVLVDGNVAGYTVVDGTTVELTTPLVGGEQLKVLDLTLLSAKLDVLDVELKANKNTPDGYVGLNALGLIDAAQLPSYVDDVVEVATYAGLPVSGEAGKIYVVVADETSGDDTSTYRWTGTVYAMVSNTLTAADVEALYEGITNTNKYTDVERVKLANTEVTSQLDVRDTDNRSTDNHTDGVTNGVYTLVERATLVANTNAISVLTSTVEW